MLFMVELEMEDFGEILKWFNHKYDEVEDKGMGEQSRKTFWKLHFLLEDKMMELRNLRDDEPKKENWVYKLFAILLSNMYVHHTCNQLMNKYSL